MSHPTNSKSTSTPPSLRLINALHGDFREVDQAMLLAGATDDEIALRFGVSRATVINYRDRLGYRTVRTAVDT